MDSFDAFEKGAIAGHKEGKRRVGVYTVGEEALVAFTANEAMFLYASEALQDEWVLGYKNGYRMAAQGLALPAEYNQCK